MIRVWRSVPKWAGWRAGVTGMSVGVVPTMGALHRGHASLVERCRRENDIAVVTIFVNPSQFNDPQDLERYPRTMEADLKLLESLGVDEVLVPGVSEMYPNGYRLRVEPHPEMLVLEGMHRPGFLQGVLTVVLKLLNLVRADRAYFGEKDYQQMRAVAELVREFFIPTEIVACPTVREPSGLAMSSRNQLLPAASRGNAPALYRILTGSETPAAARAALEAHGFQVDYVEDRWDRRLAAVFLDGIRLVDNVPVRK
ncbi:MAG: pantoate--beta-alanine ligase [Bryobacterales bacterium]|nr:pantoate--beta-alanine ligase [Bryobacterales bacterium]